MERKAKIDAQRDSVVKRDRDRRTKRGNRERERERERGRERESTYRHIERQETEKDAQTDRVKRNRDAAVRTVTDGQNKTQRPRYSRKYSEPVWPSAKTL